MAREYYSIPEAAALLGVSRIAVFKRVKAGSMPAIRVGRNWAVPASALAGTASAASAPGPLPPSAPGKTEPEASQAAFTSDKEMDSMGWD
ncbi:MAG: excisionase family DNA-binding protein [Elusimicrobia bacterium]|nr:excisionase family DNA-binding protein [Elusimicrobiota bacterium]